MKVSQLFLSATLLLSFNAGAEVNLLSLKSGQRLVIQKSFSMTNEMYEHFKRGFYLKDGTRFEARWSERGTSNHCSLSFDVGASNKAKLLKRVVLDSSSTLTVAGKVTTMSFKPSARLVADSIGNYYSKESSEFETSFEIPVQLLTSGSLLKGSLDCQFRDSSMHKSNVSSSYLEAQTKGHLNAR